MNNPTGLDVSTSVPIHSQPKKTVTTLNQYRIMIFYRFVLAFVGGYALSALSALSAIVIAQYFAEYRASAVMSATLVAFCVYCATFIWIFMVKKTVKATLGIVLPCLILFALYKMMGN